MFRVFLKEGLVRSDDKDKFFKFLRDNKEYYKLSPRLHYHETQFTRQYNSVRSTSGFFWISGKYFIDVSSEVMMTHLLIMFSELSSKVYKLAKRTEIV
jgi:hypothetical protein